MPNFKDLIQALYEITEMIFGNQPPTWLPKLLGIVLLIAIGLFAMWGLLALAAKIMDIWNNYFKPIFYNTEEKRAITRRQRFAEHVEHEIRRLNRLEDWSDYKFTELEAEVEIEGKWQFTTFSRFFQNKGEGLRKEKSLSIALKNSQERLILLEGDPGSGKSVALRHLALQLSQRAIKLKDKKSVIPIYINLKNINRKNRKINRRLIYEFVIEFINRAEDRDIDEFLEQEYDKGLENGTWIFLFDSFDEIPDILSSTESDKNIKLYADAIYDFLHGLNNCKGIIASRQYRGPGQMGWPRFRILPLSEKRKLLLAKKIGLSRDTEKRFVFGLINGVEEIQLMASNPMFLGLLLEYIREGLPFPETTHEVYKKYVSSRFERDRNRLKKAFNIAPSELHEMAEVISYCMTADNTLGLSPTYQNLKQSLKKRKLSNAARLNEILAALTYLKIGRSETVNSTPATTTFTFSHRRFQEYFATSLILKKPKLVPMLDLLSNGRWRETAVIIFQLQPTISVKSLLNLVEEILRFLKADIEKIIPLYTKDKASISGKLAFPFLWPAKTLHLLGILHAGFKGKVGELPVGIRDLIGWIISIGYKEGNLLDKKWAVEIAGTLNQNELLELIRNSLESKSSWLRETGFQQISNLPSIPEDIEMKVRNFIVRMIGGDFDKNLHLTSQALLSRLPKSEKYLSLFTWYSFVFRFDGILYSVLFILPIPVFLSGFKFDAPSLALAYLYFYSSIYVLATVFSLRISNDIKSYDQFLFVIRGAGLLTIIIIFLEFFSIPPNTYTSTFLLLLSLYLAFWLPAVAYGIKTGHIGRNIITWILAPFIALPSLLQEVLNSDLKPAIININRGVTYLLLAPVLILDSIFNDIGAFFESRRIEKWLNQVKNQVAANEFFEELSGVYYSRNLVRFVRESRTRNLLAESKDSYMIFLNMAAVLEPLFNKTSIDENPNQLEQINLGRRLIREFKKTLWSLKGSLLILIGKMRKQPINLADTPKKQIDWIYDFLTSRASYSYELLEELYKSIDYSKNF